MAIKITDEISEAILALQSPDGLLHPSKVVDHARPVDSPFHEHFEWDDHIAGEQHRLKQARELIRMVRIEVTVSERVLVIPAMVRDPGQRGVYRAIESFDGDEDKQRRLMLDEMTRVRNAINRASSLAEYFGLDGTLEQIRQLADSVSRAVREARGEDTPAGSA